MRLSFYVYVGILSVLLLACGSEKTDAIAVEESIAPLMDVKSDTIKSVEPETVVLEEIDTLEQRIIDGGLVDIQAYNANIWVDLKYSTTDNF